MKGMELPRYFEHIGARLVVHTIGPDHATVVLHDWHQVLLNGEIVSSNVTFYD